MKCNYNVIKSDGSRGKYFPLLSSLFGNIEGSEIYNYIQSKPEGVFGSLRSKGFIFSEKGLSTELSLDNNSKVALIKRNDSKALFTYSPEAPIIQEEGKGKNKKTRYNMSRIDLDTQLPFGTLREAYYKSRGYEPRLLSKPGRNKELVTPETLVALISQPVTPVVQGEIGIVFTNELTLDNINWIEVNKMIPEVAEIASKFGIAIRYNKNLEKPLNEIQNNASVDIKPVLENRTLTMVQKLNIQELQQLEPAYAKGTKEQVQSFIESLYPNSDVQEIVWHASNKKFDQFDLAAEKQTIADRGIYFAPERSMATIAYGEFPYPSVVDVKPLYSDERIERLSIQKENELIEAGYNSYVFSWNKTFKESTELIVFDPKQITILTNPKTLQKFEEFISVKPTLKETTSTLTNGDLITNTSTKKSPLIKEYRKELDKYEGLTPFSVTTLPRSEDVSIEELTIGDMLAEVDSVDKSKVNAKTEDPDYKKFLVNFTRKIDPLLSKSPVSQEYIEQILNIAAREGVSIVRQSQLSINGKFSAGYYDAGTKTIYVNEDLSSPVQLQVLLHEAIHALTVEKIPLEYDHKIHGKYRELQQLQLVYEAVKDNPKYAGLFTDLREFVAQVFTNYELQQDLRKIGTQDVSLDYGNRPLLGVVLSSVYSFFKRLFFNDKNSLKVSGELGDTLYNINHIINNYQKVYEVNNIYEFEFNNDVDYSESEDRLNTFFDVIFESSDTVSPALLQKIEDFSAEYVDVGGKLELQVNNKTFIITVVEEENQGVITINDPVEDIKLTFQLKNQNGENGLASVLDQAKEKAKESLKTRRKDLGSRLAAALNTSSHSATQEEKKARNKTLKSVGKAFRNNGATYVKRIQMTPDMKNRTGFQTWNEFVRDNPHMDLPSLKDPNIVIHKEVREGQNYYSIIMTSIEDPADSKTRKPFMNNFLDKNGKEWNSDEAFRHGFTVEKHAKGRRQLLGSLIMMKIKQNDPDAVLGQMKYFSVANTATEGNGSLQELDISEGLDNLRAFKRPDNEVIFDELPEDIRELLNDTKLLDPDQYKQSYIQLVLDHYKDLDVARNELFTDFTFDPTSPTRDRKDLLIAINQRLSELQKYNGRKNDAGKPVLEDLNDPNGREYLLLSQARAELKMNTYGYDDRQANKGMVMDGVEAYIKNRKEYFNPYLNEAGKAINKIIASFKEKFNIYAKKKNKYTSEFIEEYIKDKGASLRNMILNYTPVFYENLYERIDVRKIDKHGRISNDTVTVNTMKLKPPTDKSLTNYEAKYVTNVLSSIRSASRDLIANHIKTKALYTKEEGTIEQQVLNWEKDNMKIQVDHNGNVIDWGGYLFVPGLKGGWIQAMSKGNLKQGLKAEFDFLHTEYLDSHDNGSIDNAATLGILTSFTLNGSENSTYGRNSRLKNIGLISKDGELLLQDEALNNNVNTDLQAASDFYVAKLLKQEKYPELQREYLTGKLLLLNQSIAEGAKMKYEFKVFEDQTRALVDNTVKDLKLGGVDKDIAKIISSTTQLVGRAVLAGSFGSIYTAFTGATTTAFIASLSMKFGKRFPGIKTVGKAAKFVTNPVNWKFVSDIMHAQQLHNSDEGKMIFNDNVKAGSNTFLGMLKGLPTGRNTMLPIGLGDYFVKSVLYVAQLMHDDIIQNYKYDENNDLYYDRQAERDNPSKNPYRRAEFELFDEQLEAEGRYIREDGNPLVAYTYDMTNNLKTISATLLGAFTDEERTLLSLDPIAKIGTQFKTFLLPKANMLYSRGYTNTNITYYQYNSSGEIEKVHPYMEGLVQTIWDLRNVISMADGLNKEEWTRIMSNETKVANLKFAGISLCLFAIAYAAYAAVDDEWKKKNPYHIYLKASIFDLIGYMNPVEYANAITTPVSIVYAKRVANTLWKAITWDLEEAGDQAMKLTGATRTIMNFKQLVEEDLPRKYTDF